MTSEETMLDSAVGVIAYAQAVNPHDTNFTLAHALFMSVLQEEQDTRLLQLMAEGDNRDTGALNIFIDRHGLGGFVGDHVVDCYHIIAHNELANRENPPTAWDVETKEVNYKETSK